MRRLWFLVVLIVLTMSSFLPEAYGQTTTVTVQSPSEVLINNSFTVKTTVRWDGARSGYWLGAGLIDLATGDFVRARPEASPKCVYVEDSACIIIVYSSSGILQIEYTLRAPSYQTTLRYSMRALLGPPSGPLPSSYSQRNFSVIVAKEMTLTIRVPEQVSVTLDGSEQPRGDVTMVYKPPQRTHAISVPDTVDIGPGTRLKFERWLDGNTSPDRSVFLTDDLTIEAVYLTQYYVEVQGVHLNATGTGWYTTGTSAQFSIPSESAEMEGLLGQLGGVWRFRGWSIGGSMVSGNRTASVMVDKPLTIVAEWSADYLYPAAFTVVAIVGVAFSIGIIYNIRGKKLETHLPPVAVQPPIPELRFCIECGSEVIPGSRFCGACGARLDRTI